MIDMALMAALLEALPARTRLILLGDRSQLASVEAGSLFADLCDQGASQRPGNDEPAWSSELCAQLHQITGEAFSPSKTSKGESQMEDSLVFLRTGYRFQQDSGIGSLAAAVQNGSMEAIEQVIAAQSPHLSDLHVEFCTGSLREHWLREAILTGFQDMMEATSPEQAFAAMERFRLLCALRKGPAGTEGLNRLATSVLRRAGYITSETEWYQGRPIIILRNHYELQLFNGDTGILWRDESRQLRAWFQRPDGTLQPVAPARLPEHATAYAVTVHKAQGSEFDRVLLVLPEEENRVLRRELLYTGITRARKKFILCADQEILAATVKQQTVRYSGLRGKLHQQLSTAASFAK